MLFQFFLRVRYEIIALGLLAACATEGNIVPATEGVGQHAGYPSTSAPTPGLSPPKPTSAAPGAPQFTDTIDQGASLRSSGNAVYFQRGSIVLDDVAIAVLRRHAERLRENLHLVVTLVGHTDHLGSRSFNLAIAEQRTAAVKAKLREFGVAAKKIRERSYGYEQPGAACAGEPCRRKMRRVDLLYPKPRAERRLGEQKR